MLATLTRTLRQELQIRMPMTSRHWPGEERGNWDGMSTNHNLERPRKITMQEYDDVK